MPELIVRMILGVIVAPFLVLLGIAILYCNLRDYITGWKE